MSKPAHNLIDEAAAYRHPAASGGKWLAKDKRHAIYLRDGRTCAYCGRAVVVGAHVSVSGAATVDHVVPEVEGGGREAANLVTSCVGCNSSKGAQSMRSWLKVLRSRGVDTDAARREIRNRTGRNLAPFRAEAKRQIAAGLI